MNATSLKCVLSLMTVCCVMTSCMAHPWVCLSASDPEAGANCRQYCTETVTVQEGARTITSFNFIHNSNHTSIDYIEYLVSFYMVAVGRLKGV